MIKSGKVDFPLDFVVRLTFDFLRIGVYCEAIHSQGVAILSLIMCRRHHRQSLQLSEFTSSLDLSGDLHLLDGLVKVIPKNWVALCCTKLKIFFPVDSISKYYCNYWVTSQFLKNYDSVYGLLLQSWQHYQRFSLSVRLLLSYLNTFKCCWYS